MSPHSHKKKRTLNFRKVRGTSNVGSRLAATSQALVLSTQAMVLSHQALVFSHQADVADRATGHHHRVEDTMMIGASETRRSW